MRQQIRDGVYRPAAIALIGGALAMLGPSACGGSGSSGSSGPSTATRASATASSGGVSAQTKTGATGTTPAPPRTTNARPRPSTLRGCLERNGVKLPGERGGRHGLFLGGAKLPIGGARTRLQAALRKCLSGNRPSGVRAPGAHGLGSPGFRKALEGFAACLRRNGVKVASPDTSGHGPVFSTKGIATASPKFRAASRKCRGELRAMFQRRP